MQHVLPLALGNRKPLGCSYLVYSGSGTCSAMTVVDQTQFTPQVTNTFSGLCAEWMPKIFEGFGETFICGANIRIIYRRKQHNSVGFPKSPHELGTTAYVRAKVCVHPHARRDVSDLSGTGTSQRTTVGEIQFSGGDRRASGSVTE